MQALIRASNIAFFVESNRLKILNKIKSVGNGTHCMDSLSIELSYKSVN